MTSFLTEKNKTANANASIFVNPRLTFYNSGQEAQRGGYRRSQALIFSIFSHIVYLKMIENQQTSLALGYVGTTMLLCPLVALLGWKLSESVLSST